MREGCHSQAAGAVQRLRFVRASRQPGKGSSMIGPVLANQDEPNDPAAYREHLLLLKSMHCARPVMHKGLKQYISCLTANRDGGRISMTVYLAGKAGGFDSSEIGVMPMNKERTTA